MSRLRGFDLLLPSADPLLLNAKLGVPEDKLFPYQPSLAIGIMGVGTKTSTATTLGTDYNLLYAQVQHTILGGYVSAGGYYGLQDKLYGASVLVLEDSLRQRATFCAGDSFLSSVTSKSICTYQTLASLLTWMSSLLARPTATTAR